MKRFAILVILAALSMPAFATPVLAVAPDNDTYAGRTVIASIPFSDALDTSEATMDDDDAEINAQCGAPGFEASVWYELTLDAGAAVLVDVTDADYTTGVAVATGSPGSFSVVQCQPGAAVFDAIAGEPYAIVVFDDQPDGGGGTLTITVDGAPPPPTIDLELDPEGTYNPITDLATISGAVTCSETMLVEVFVEVRQSIGRHTVLGSGFIQIECGPVGTSGPIDVAGFTSALNPGTVTVMVNASGCTSQCAEAYLEAEVRLRPAPAQPPPPPPPPSNDEPDGATSIGLGETTTQETSGATMGASDPVDCPTEAVPPSGHTVWYAFTAPDEGLNQVDTIGSDYDTVVFVLAPDGSVAACDDDIEPGVDQDSLAIFAGTAGATYLIMVGSFDNSPAGTMILTVTETDDLPPPPPPPPSGEAPLNDDRADAISLIVGDSIAPVDTSATTAGDDDPLPSCAPPSSRTVWYTLTVETAGWIEINTFGSDFDTVLVVVADGSQVACNDDFQGLQSRGVFFAEPGVTYEVMAGNFGGSPGGMLVVSVLPGEQPLMIELGPDLATELDMRSGAVTVRGTVYCTEDAVVELIAGLDQQNGRFGVTGGAEAFVEACSPDGASFEMTIVGNEAYRPGEASLFLEAFAFSADDTAFTFFGETVRLRSGGTGR